MSENEYLTATQQLDRKAYSAFPRIPFRLPGALPPMDLPIFRVTPLRVGQVLKRLVLHPGEMLLSRWNWKSAILSSGFRAALFFATNLAAGLPAAVAALQTELLFRGITSGFYGALTEAFREAEPPWAAAVTVMILLPFANHSVEFLVHWARGTRKLVPSIIASVAFTALSTLFNFFVMRRGALIVGAGRGTLSNDLRRLPRLLLDFVCWLPKRVLRSTAHGSGDAPANGH